MSDTGRREFVALLGGAAAAWPLAARAQQIERVRRIGVLLPATADDPVWQTRFGAFLQGLQQSGWSIGQNVRIETRWATINAAEIRRHAAELASLAPDVVLAYGTSTMGAWRQATRTVPTVFVAGADPVGLGFADSLARPGGNATGFMAFEFSFSGKWLELLKQIAPGVTRAAVLRDTTIGSGASQFAAIQAVAPSLRMEVSPVNVGSAGQIERDIVVFARTPNGGLIGAGSAPMRFHRDLIRVRRRRRPDLLWVQLHRPVPAGRQLCRSYPQGRKTSRPAGAGTYQIRAGDQSKDRESTRHRHTPDVV